MLLKLPSLRISKVKVIPGHVLGQYTSRSTSDHGRHGLDPSPGRDHGFYPNLGPCPNHGLYPNHDRAVRLKYSPSHQLK